ncbi:MAG TPA: ribbon-helix-helix domain-containing protein [Ramlibacter sp.]|jgi:transcriptional regulatory protein LevR|nr:ribbon-helix-helix domain-containing protein [Ramlibacter sp.]
MTITVRLPQELEQALEQYSAEQGLTKSHVVQEALATYLAHCAKPRARGAEKVSENFRAMKKAGLIGCVTGMGGASATKEVVRQRALARVGRSG